MLFCKFGKFSGCVLSDQVRVSTRIYDNARAIGDGDGMEYGCLF
jgi:hypothetical protein